MSRRRPNSALKSAPASTRTTSGVRRRVADIRPGTQPVRAGAAGSRLTQRRRGAFLVS